MTNQNAQIDPCKVAVYIRWSTDDQSEGTTLEVQTEGCRHYAMSQGWAITERLTFIDDGYSGATLDRPALTRLRKAIANGDVECVIVFKLDRLSRSVPDMIRLIMDEWEGKCHIKSAREALDTTSQTGRMVFYMLANFAEWERSVIKERTFSGKLRRAQEGKNPGMGAPYGYLYDPQAGIFHIVPHEAEIVRRIYEMYRAGAGIRTIAVKLNELGLLFRGGRFWVFTGVRRILRNPAYSGTLVFGRTAFASKTSKKRVSNPNPHLINENFYPPIMSKEEWESVQAIKQERPSPANRRSGRSHSSPYLLSGILRCGICGAAMSACGTSNPLGSKYQYYQCTAASQGGKMKCASRRIPLAILDDLVSNRLKELYSTAIARSDLVESMSTDRERRKAAVIRGLDEIETAWQKNERKWKKLRAAWLEETVSQEEYHSFAADLQQETNELQDRRESLKKILRSLEAIQSEKERLARVFAELDHWGVLDRPAQKELVRTLVHRITAYRCPDTKVINVDITWRVADETTGHEQVTGEEHGA